MTLTQLSATPEMRGRVMSIMMMTFGLMPIGALPFGTIAEYIGTSELTYDKRYIVVSADAGVCLRVSCVQAD